MEHIVDAYSVFRLLQTAQGSLLDDEQLVNTLNSSKITSQEVAEQLTISEQTEIKIDAAREVLLLTVTVYQILSAAGGLGVWGRIKQWGYGGGGGGGGHLASFASRSLAPTMGGNFFSLGLSCISSIRRHQIPHMRSSVKY